MSPSSSSLAKLRIVAINDCYELTNLPKLQTFLKKLSPKANCVVLAGDFLSPSTLSSIDGGRGMVATLRALGLTHACLGNHEADLHWPQLQNRIEELTRQKTPKTSSTETTSNSKKPSKKSRGVQLINTNLREPPLSASKLKNNDWINIMTHPERTPPYSMVTTACGRVNVALLGLVSDERTVFRDGTFRGAPIANVLDSYRETYEQIMSNNNDDGVAADFVLPLTHMSLDRDTSLAKLMLELQPASQLPGIIIGGHEHEPYDVKVYPGESGENEIVSTSSDDDGGSSQNSNDGGPHVRILKSGTEAENATLIDLTFDAEDPVKPLIQVEADIVSMEPYEPSKVVQSIVKQRMSVIDNLAGEIIVHAETLLPPGTPLSSERSRFQQTTVGAVLCKAVKDEMEHVDACIINGATIKGNTVYNNDRISYADLKKELPFPTKIVVVPMKRWELMEAIHYSRRYTEEGVLVKEEDNEDVQPVPRRGYLQVDLDFNADGIPAGGPVLEDIVQVALPRNLLSGFCRIQPLMDLGKRLKEEGNFPGPDDFVPAILLIVRHFCKNQWIDIVKNDIQFDDIDLNGDQVLDRQEIKIMMEKFLGHEPPEFVVNDMIDAIDADEDGVIDAGEFSYLLATMEREDLFRKL